MGSRKLTVEQERVIVDSYLKGSSMHDLARENEVSRPTIRAVLQRNQVECRSIQDRGPTPPPLAWVEAEAVRYRLEGLSVQTIARRVGVRTTTIAEVLEARGLHTRMARGVNAAFRRKVSVTQEPDLISSYLAGATLTTLAERHACSEAAIRNTLLRLGVDLRPAGKVQSRSRTPEFEASVLKDWETGLSQTDISSKLGCSQGLISRTLQRLGVQTRPQQEKHWAWKGGRHTDPLGYVHVRLSNVHQFACMRNVSGYALEHRLVMAEHLDRPLEARETVHHVNGVRSDNRVENLQLRMGQHGKHAAFECADCGSHNILSVPLREG